MRVARSTPHGRRRGRRCYCRPHPIVHKGRRNDLDNEYLADEPRAPDLFEGKPPPRIEIKGVAAYVVAYAARSENYRNLDLYYLHAFGSKASMETIRAFGMEPQGTILRIEEPAGDEGQAGQGQGAEDPACGPEGLEGPPNCACRRAGGQGLHDLRDCDSARLGGVQPRPAEQVRVGPRAFHPAGPQRGGGAAALLREAGGSLGAAHPQGVRQAALGRPQSSRGPHTVGSRSSSCSPTGLWHTR